jgi:hypothetical protein
MHSIDRPIDVLNVCLEACFWLTVGEVGAGEAVTSATATALPQLRWRPCCKLQPKARVVGTSILFLAYGNRIGTIVQRQRSRAGPDFVVFFMRRWRVAWLLVIKWHTTTDRDFFWIIFFNGKLQMYKLLSKNCKFSTCQQLRSRLAYVAMTWQPSPAGRACRQLDDR